jgi:ribonuclease D
MVERKMISKLIEQPDQLDEVISGLEGAEVLFIDTEFESRRGGTDLCLVQVTDGEVLYLIDAVTIRDLTPLADVLGHPDVLWVTHAGRQDVDLMMKALRLRRRPALYDTQVAWSLLSAEHQVSLAYLVSVLLGLHREKGHQTDNWMRRPLTDEQLSYAADDAEDLLALYDVLNKRLDRLDRRDLVVEVSRETFTPPPARAEHISLSKYRNLWQLNAAQQAALSALLGWHNSLKGHRGTPHYKTLFSIAARLPENARALGDIKGVNPRFAQSEQGADMLDLIADSTEGVDETVSSAGPAPYATFDQYFREAWLVCARAEISADLSMAPEVAFPPWLMKRLRPAVKETIDLSGLAREFDGWRTCLQKPWRQFCEKTDA